MFDTRDPDAFDHEDPRKSIKAAPSFEEYLKQRDGAAAAPVEPRAGLLPARDGRALYREPDLRRNDQPLR